MAGFFPPDDSSAVPVLPTPKAAGTTGYFTDGSLTTPATIVDCDFLNGLVIEFQDLSSHGGIALNKTTPTMVPNINALINAGLTAYVRKVGDTMTGNLTLGTNYGGNNAAPSLIVQSGTTTLNVVMNSTAGNQNTVTQAGDTLLYFTDGAANTGALTIAPYGSGSTGGLRMDNTGQVTFNRAVTMSGGATATTSAQDTNTTAVATTAFVLAQAGTASPTMDGSAAAGTSLRWAKQDHVHPTDTSRQAALGFNPVQQGGGNYQFNDKVYLGWDATGVRVQVNSSDLGRVWTDSLQAFTITGAAASGWYGYTKLPNALIIQWGSQLVSSPQGVYFPITFPNACLQVVVCEGNGNGGTWGSGAPTMHACSGIAANGYIGWSSSWNGSGWSGGITITQSFFAIGY